MEDRGENVRPSGDGGNEGQAAVVRAATRPSTGLPVFGHRSLTGTVEGKIEDNGRVIIPATYRHAFGDGHLLAVPGGDDHVRLYTQRSWEVYVDAVVAREPEQFVDPALRSDLFSLAIELQIDKQFRIVLPADLRSEAGLGQRIVFVGAIEVLKIMQPPAADQVKERAGMLRLLQQSWGGMPTDPV